MTPASYLSKLRQLEQAATKGEWLVYDNIKHLLGVFNKEDDCIISVRNGLSRENAEFIAASRTAIPRLLGMIEKLKKAAELAISQWHALHENLRLKREGGPAILSENCQDEVCVALRQALKELEVEE